MSSWMRAPGELLERVELLRRSGQLEGDRVGAEVDDAALERFGVEISSARRSGLRSP